jgi:hypothetical protein
MLPAGPAVVAVVIALAGGCGAPSAHTTSWNFGLRGDVPVDPPRLHSGAYDDDCVAGGELFKLYCGSCHNARPIGERPFNNYHVAVTHMRDQAYLTGKEYRKIIQFMRRWNDIGPPTPATTPSPKRFEFSQPISELKGEPPQAGAALPPLPSDRPSPWQMPGTAGNAPPLKPGAGSAAAAREQPSGVPAPID